MLVLPSPRCDSQKGVWKSKALLSCDESRWSLRLLSWEPVLGRAQKSER